MELAQLSSYQGIAILGHVMRSEPTSPTGEKCEIQLKALEKANKQVLS